MIGAAHPVNFIGTQANTRSGARPFLRLAHTAKIFETIFFGTRAEADAALAFVDRLHRRVRGELAEAAGRWPAGTAYSAFDPPLMLWTVAVIADSAEAFFETFVRPLGAPRRTRCGATTCASASSSACPARRRPPPTRGFRDYWERMWTGGELHLTDEAREVALAVAFEIPMPRYLHPSREVHNLVLLGTLPARVRRMFGLRWTPAHAAAFRAAVAAMRAARPVTPRAMRTGEQHAPRSSSSPAPRSSSSPPAARRCRRRRGRPSR